MSYLWEGVVGRFSKLGNGVSRAFRLTAQGSLAVAQVEGAGTERLRSNSRFYGGCQVIANGIDPDTAIPTTTPKLLLYNSASAGGKSLVVDWVAFSLGSGTPTAGATLLLAPSRGVLAAAPSAGTNYSSQCAASNTTATVAVWATTSTLPANTVWMVAGANMQLAAANVGQGDTLVSIPGGLLIPPLCGLGIGILSGTGTSPKYLVSAGWDELVLDTE